MQRGCVRISFRQFAQLSPREQRREIDRWRAARDWAAYKNTPAYLWQEAKWLNHNYIIEGPDPDQHHPDIIVIRNELYGPQHIGKQQKTREKQLTDVSVVMANLIRCAEGGVMLICPLNEQFHKEVPPDDRRRASPKVSDVLRKAHYRSLVEKHKSYWIDRSKQTDGRTGRATRWSIEPKHELRWPVPVRSLPVVLDPVDFVILRDENKQPVRYKDTELDLDLQGLLRRTNDLLKHTSITYDPGGGRDAMRVKLRAIFHNSRWDHGGRLYPVAIGGRSYQNIPKVLRPTILLNGRPCCELDFGAMHLMLPYARLGIQLTGDPYNIPAVQGDPLRRTVAKIAYFAVLNADNRYQVIAVTRSQIEDTIERRDEELEGFGIFDDGTVVLEPYLQNELRRLLQRQPNVARDIVNGLEDAHSRIAKFFYTQAGFMFMHDDARVSWYIVERFVNLGIPILPLFDGFIVELRHRALLTRTMHDAYRHVAEGFECEVRTVWPRD